MFLIFSSFFQKLQQILDDSPEGVIYISFGTGVRLSNEPKVVEAINKTVSKLPYTVLWKIEDSLSLHITGKNVFAQEWFPQQDLLGIKDKTDCFYIAIRINECPYSTPEPQTVHHPRRKTVGRRGHRAPRPNDHNPLFRGSVHTCPQNR